MEVASPLTFSHSAGTKRHLPCSTGFVDSANRSPFGMAMEPPEEYVNQRFKRRRCNLDDRMDSDSENAPSQFHHYLAAPPVPEKSVFSPSNGESIVDFPHVSFVLSGN